MSVSVNASHASLFCAEAWGSEPRFTWLHDNAAVTTALGRVSVDGKTLFFSSTPVCGHFTCVVSNRLGHSSATYTAGMLLETHTCRPEPCRPTHLYKHSCRAVLELTVSVVCVLRSLPERGRGRGGGVGVSAGPACPRRRTGLPAVEVHTRTHKYTHTHLYTHICTSIHTHRHICT